MPTRTLVPDGPLDLQRTVAIHLRGTGDVTMRIIAGRIVRAAVWLYAAIRPRYGAGVGTAVRAGVANWFFSCVYMTIVVTNLGVFAFNATQLCLDLVATVEATQLP